MTQWLDVLANEEPLRRSYTLGSQQANVVALAAERCMTSSIPVRWVRWMLEALLEPRAPLTFEKRVAYPMGGGRINHVVELRQDWEVINQLLQAELVREIRRSKGLSRYETTVTGFMVLKHWANTRKGFDKFFRAYCPQEGRWLKTYRSRWVVEKVDQVVVGDQQLDTDSPF